MTNFAALRAGRPGTHRASPLPMVLRPALFVTLALALAGGAARADKVDWSQYIDHDAKPTPQAPPANPVASDAPASKPVKATKKVAAKPKAKAKAKARRRH